MFTSEGVLSMLQIQGKITVECPDVATTNDYPPRIIPGGKIVAWNESPEKREKYLIFLIKWERDGWEIFRKSVYKKSTLNRFVKGEGYFLNTLTKNEIKTALKEKRLFPYASSSRERTALGNVLKRIAA